MAQFKVQLIPMYEDRKEEPMDITTGGIIVGREDDCEYVIKGDGVSRYHACFFLDGGVTMVEDLESTNGVIVNGTAIKGKQRLKPGDVVQVCDFSFLIAGSRNSAAPGTRARVCFLLVALIIMLLGIISLVNYLNGRHRNSAISVNSLNILSDPTGAQLYDHGKLVGKTPMQLENLQEGNYRLLLRMDGYKDKEIIVSVPQGATRKIHSLERINAPSELRVRSLPSDAKVYVNGIFKGKTPAPPGGEGESEALIIKNMDISVRHKIHISVNNRTSPTVLSRKWLPDVNVILWQPDSLVEMVNGAIHLGMIRSKNDAGSLTLAMEDGEDLTLLSAEIKSIKRVVPPLIKDRSYGVTINNDADGVIELTVDPFPDDEY